MSGTILNIEAERRWPVGALRVAIHANRAVAKRLQIAGQDARSNFAGSEFERRPQGDGPRGALRVAIHANNAVAKRLQTTGQDAQGSEYGRTHISPRPQMYPAPQCVPFAAHSRHRDPGAADVCGKRPSRARLPGRRLSAPIISASIKKRANPGLALS